MNRPATGKFRNRTRLLGSSITIAVAVATSLALVGCGSGTAGGGGESITKVSVGYSSPGASYSDLYAGLSEGIFASNGLDVDLRTLNSSSQVVPALLSGSVDIAVGSATEAAAAIMKGSKLKIVAITRPVFNLELYTKPEIKSAADLQGQKIGLTSPGSQSDQALTAMLKANGMTRDDVEPTYVKSIPGQLAALQSGSVAAILSQPPQAKAAVDRGYTALIKLSDIPFPSAAVMVTNEFLTKHPEVIDAFIKSEVTSLKLLHSDEKAALAAIRRYSGVQDADAAKYAYDFFKDVWATDPTVKESLVAQAFELAAEGSGEPMPAALSQFIDNSFVQKYV